MQIRKLKLSGFKSFVEPTELHIEPGLTGVVGPNGCGKSNLLEAIRWVMGENSPKSMRSGGMEDVIFAGTQTRPPRDFAEIVLHAVVDDGEELIVTRRIERGAGSAYQVNGMDVRAKDVVLTFADAAAGAHSPALVSQGRIAAVIAAKPAERRQMLEEAAGIAGLHVRRRDAENKLRQTENNLARLEDLMAGLDSQINSLRRQARQAERYKLLSDQIQIAEARMLYARWRDAARAAEAARAQAKQADDKVEQAQSTAQKTQKSQHLLAEKLNEQRDILADRRDDATAQGHRMATLTSQLESAQQRLADLNRQKQRLEEDRKDADRMTCDAAEALKALEQSLAQSEKSLAEDEEKRPIAERAATNAEQASRTAELALAKATADHAGVEAEWRVAESEVAGAKSQLTRLDSEQRRIDGQRSALAQAGNPAKALTEAKQQAQAASAHLSQARDTLAASQAKKTDLAKTRDMAAEGLSSAKADLTGIEREWQGLKRDREARAKRTKNQQSLPSALDAISANPGYERALAAVLGRDAKSPLGVPEGQVDGRFWTGSTTPTAVADSLANHLGNCPEQLSARLALVHVADTDDGRMLSPGEWLVTKAGFLRRWDGFVARGEGAAQAAQLEADNRFADLDSKLPALREAAETAANTQAQAQADLSQLQASLMAMEREVNHAAEAERQALRAMDSAEAQKDRLATRGAELDQFQTALTDQRAQAEADIQGAENRRQALPDPASGRALLNGARDRNESARGAHQSAAAALASQDQTLAVARERVAAQRSDIRNWQDRAGDAAKRLSGMALRFEEVEQERAVIAAKPASLIQEIEDGEEIRIRLARELSAAEAGVAASTENARAADQALAAANEALADAREARAGLSARAENEESRREEMARISGERFQCPPPILARKFEFEPEGIAASPDESLILEKLTSDRERIGPVNLVATQELEKIEEAHGSSAAEQEELAEAVNRLRGSIGNLNREGRERLRTAFEEVDRHFRKLFTRLFEGGQAHLALIDSEDPLEAGLEIYAQPPGKRLQSLTLLSGGEQALTAVALIFALFLTNPAPICVLDEVDAPLDDANIDRFCDLLDEMNRETKTRYLIVTHNAVTMSRLDRLFGVTMVEPGVSRLVSVDLGGAEDLLAV